MDIKISTDHLAESKDSPGILRELKLQGFFVAALHGEHQSELGQKIPGYCARTVGREVNPARLHHQAGIQRRRAAVHSPGAG